MNYICTSIVAIASICITGTSHGGILPFELIPLDGAAGGAFGTSAAISGNTCVVGAWGTSNAYVYTANANGTWSQVAELTASEPEDHDLFGWNVAVDNHTCMIGAYGNNSVYVFSNEAKGTWSPLQELTVSGLGSLDSFGGSIAIDGHTCVIGAWGGNSGSGSAYVFNFVPSEPGSNTGDWHEFAELTPSDLPSGDFPGFGRSVDIHDDTCVVGTSGINGTIGRAYVFTSNANGTWSQVAELEAPNGTANNGFGSSVAIDSDTCVIGAWGTNNAYVFTSNANGTWSQVAELESLNGTANNYFGSSVAIDSDTCMIGAPGANNGIGSAYLFAYGASGIWSQIAILDDPDSTSQHSFGCSVNIDDSNYLIGASGTNSGNGGSAYVYGNYISIPGDLDNDGDVDTDDLNALHDTLGINNTDVNNNGCVDIDDLLYVIEDWNEGCSGL